MRPISSDIGSSEYITLLCGGPTQVVPFASDRAHPRYKNKLVAQANTNAAYDFCPKAARREVAFRVHRTFYPIYARTQTKTLTEQTKQLAELAQKIALATTALLKVGVAKAFNPAA